MIEVLFTCHECKLIKKRVRVRLRREDEDIGHYMTDVGRACGDMHMILSPVCRNDRVDVYLPVAKDAEKGIGQEPAAMPEGFENRPDPPMEKA
jgi:hypothetical protein